MLPVGSCVCAIYHDPCQRRAGANALENAFAYVRCTIFDVRFRKLARASGALKSKSYIGSSLRLLHCLLGVFFPGTDAGRMRGNLIRSKKLS